jgi:hypothetical protein
MGSGATAERRASGGERRPLLDNPRAMAVYLD